MKIRLEFCQNLPFLSSPEQFLPEQGFPVWIGDSPPLRWPYPSLSCHMWHNLPVIISSMMKHTNLTNRRQVCGLTWVDEVFYNQSVVNLVGLIVAKQKLRNAQTKETWVKDLFALLNLLFSSEKSFCGCCCWSIIQEEKEHFHSPEHSLTNTRRLKSHNNLKSPAIIFWERLASKCSM